MCLYVIAVLPKSAPHEALAEIGRKHGRGLSSFQNASLKLGLRSDEVPLLTTRGHCDCGCSLFGSSRRDPKTLERNLKKLRAKRWSEAKIERWVQSTEPVANTRDNEPWAALIEAALALPRVPYVGLLGHWFSKTHTTETMPVRERVARTTAVLFDPEWDGLEHDVLHVFRRV